MNSDRLRNIGAVVAGWLVGSVANMALIVANTALFPLPQGVEFTDQEAFAAYVAGLPDAAFILPMVAHLAQAFVGGWVAARIGSKPVRLAMIVGVISLVGGVMNALMVGPPAWMWVEMPLYLAVAWAAGRIAET